MKKDEQIFIERVASSIDLSIDISLLDLRFRDEEGRKGKRKGVNKYPSNELRISSISRSTFLF